MLKLDDTVLILINSSPSYVIYIIDFQVPATEGLTHDKLKNYLNLTFPNVELSEKATDRGYLLLDYHWQKSMGDFKFNEIDFPNVSETIKMVK